jgi:transposase
MTKKAVGNAGKVYKSYTEEFRRDAVRMIETEGLTTAEVARRLGVNANLLRKWREKYGKKSEAQSVQSDLEAENRRLRDENRRLLMEREILKKAAAFFANETN